MLGPKSKLKGNVSKTKKMIAVDEQLPNVSPECNQNLSRRKKRKLVPEEEKESDPVSVKENISNGKKKTAHKKLSDATDINRKEKRVSVKLENLETENITSTPKVIEKLRERNLEETVRDNGNNSFEREANDLPRKSSNVNGRGECYSTNEDSEPKKIQVKSRAKVINNTIVRKGHKKNEKKVNDKEGLNEHDITQKYLDITESSPYFSSTYDVYVHGLPWNVTKSNIQQNLRNIIGQENLFKISIPKDADGVMGYAIIHLSDKKTQTTILNSQPSIFGGTVQKYYDENEFRTKYLLRVIGLESSSNHKVSPKCYKILKEMLYEMGVKEFRFHGNFPWPSLYFMDESSIEKVLHAKKNVDGKEIKFTRNFDPSFVIIYNIALSVSIDELVNILKDVHIIDIELNIFNDSNEKRALIEVESVDDIKKCMGFQEMELHGLKLIILSSIDC